MRTEPPGCLVCGGGPTAELAFRGLRELVVVPALLRYRGPYCRTCGTATHRAVLTESLWQGWWGLLPTGLSPVVALVNLPQRRLVDRLPPPLADPPRPPLAPGRPVHRRPEALGLAVPLLLAGLLLVRALSGGEDHHWLHGSVQPLRPFSGWTVSPLELTIETTSPIRDSS